MRTVRWVCVGAAVAILLIVLFGLSRPWSGLAVTKLAVAQQVRRLTRGHLARVDKLAQLQHETARVVDDGAPYLARLPPPVVRLADFERKNQRNGATQDSGQHRGNRRQVNGKKVFEHLKEYRKQKDAGNVGANLPEDVPDGKTLTGKHRIPVGGGLFVGR